jgi:hypothetical protein
MSRERYGMNMSQADADRLAWRVMAVLYCLSALPVGLLLLTFGLAGDGGPKAVVYGLAVLAVPVWRRHRIHQHFSPKRGS